MAKYENDMFLLCETSNAFLVCFFLFQNPFLHSLYSLGPFKSIKIMLKFLHVLLGLSPVWDRYPKGGHKKGTD